MTTKIGQIGQELARTNPWWRSDTWAREDQDLRAARDSGLGYRSPCLDDLVEGGLYLLRGPRRVGKTVAVKQAIASLLEGGAPPHSIVRVAADGWSANELRTVVQNVALPPLPEGVCRWWFLDEVTAAIGDWASQVKWLRDNDPDFATATVVLTGSNAGKLTEAAGVLAGRRGRVPRSDRTLLPMGFRTFVRLMRPVVTAATRLTPRELRSASARDAYATLLPWLDDLVRAWELYLQYGGFPVSVAAARSGRPVPAWFLDDLFAVIFRDAFAASRLSEATTSALLSRLMETMASPANLSKIGDDVGIGQDAVTRHVGYLRDAYLVWSCPQRAERAWVPRRRAQDKLYATDPLVARLSHLRNPAHPDIDPTVLAEMQIGMALRRAADDSGQPWAGEEFLFHVRTPARKEIDFVAEVLAGAAIEGKYVEGGRWQGDAATVDASAWSGLLVTRNVLNTRADDDHAWAVPAGILAFLVDT